MWLEFLQVTSLLYCLSFLFSISNLHCHMLQVIWNVRAHTHTHTQCIHTHTWKFLKTHKHTHTHTIHTYIWIHTHTQTHTHNQPTFNKQNQTTPNYQQKKKKTSITLTCHQQDPEQRHAESKFWHSSHIRSRRWPAAESPHTGRESSCPPHEWPASHRLLPGPA